MGKVAVFIYRSDIELRDIPLEIKASYTLIQIKVKGELDLLKVLLGQEIKKAERIYLSSKLSVFSKSLGRLSEVLKDVILLKSNGREVSVDEVNKKKLSKKIQEGIQEAKRLGKEIGAPKGNLNRQNKLKVYDENEVQQVESLIKSGHTYRDIVTLVPFNISISKISYMRKRINRN